MHSKFDSPDHQHLQLRLSQLQGQSSGMPPLQREQFDALIKDIESVLSHLFWLDPVSRSSSAEELAQILHHADLFSSLHDAIIATDTDMRVTAWNRAAEELYGIEAQQAIGKSVQELIQSYLSRDDPQNILNNLQHGKTNQMIVDQMTVNGRAVTVEGMTIAQENSDRQVSGYISVIRDITERKRAEEERARLVAQMEQERQNTAGLAELYAQQAEEMEAIFSAIADGVIIYDMDGNYQKLNPAAIRGYGFNPIGKDRFATAQILNIRHPNNVPLEPHEFPSTRALQGEIVSGMHIRFNNIEGQELSVVTSASPVYTGGKQTGAVVVWHDISEGTRLSAEIHRQSELLERLVLNVPVGIGIYQGPEQRFTIANPTFLHILQKKNELAGQTIAEAWPEFSDQFLPLVDKAYHLGESYRAVDMPFHLVREKGLEEAYFTFSLTPLFNEDGQVQAVLILIHETTDQVEIRNDLKAEQNRLKAIIDNAPEAIIVADKDARILLANPVAEQLYARPVPYHQGVNSQAELQVCYPNGELCDPRQLPLTRSALDGEICNNLELEIRWPDGQIKPILVNTAPIRDHKGEISGAVGVFQDITQRKEVERERRKSAAQMEVQRYLNEYREHERLQIAHEIHDGPLQELIGLSFWLTEAIQMASDDMLRAKLDAMLCAVQKQVHEMRSFCNELRPPALAPFGLEKAIRSHLDSLRNLHPGLDCQMDLMGDGQMLSEQMRLVLFRIYKELVNNVIKHAHASRISVRFSFDDESIQLEVQDNGHGFEVPAEWLQLARQGHLGLVGIQERAESIGGIVEMVSGAGRGTLVRVKAPIIQKPSDPLSLP